MMEHLIHGLYGVDAPLEVCAIDMCRM